MPRPIYINATFHISTRRNFHGTDLVVLSYSEYISRDCTRLWRGEGRTLWEALADTIYNACDAGWIQP